MDLGLLKDNLPIVVRFCGNRFVPLNPINNHFSNLLTGSINYRSAFVHYIPAAAIDAIIVRSQLQFLILKQRFASELKVLDSLPERLCDV